MGRTIPTLAVIATVVLLSPQPGFAQTNDEGQANLEFTFQNPGARALAMGGAFLGMADDATTALANPAGLTNIVKPQASIEFTSANYQNEIPWTRGWGSYTEEAGGTKRDFRYSFDPASNPSTLNYISFASFVYRIPKHRIAVSAFFDNQTAFNRSFVTSGFTMFVKDKPYYDYYRPTRSNVEMHLRSLGASVAYRPNDLLAAGLTLAYSHLHIESLTERLIGNFVKDAESLSGSQGKIAVTVGVLIKPAERFSLGGVYTRRATYSLRSTYMFEGVTYEQAVNFRVPDKYGVGASIRATDSISVNMDIVRVLYSQLMDGYYSFRYREGIDPPADRVYGKDTFEISDATEYRVGAEYLRLMGNWPVCFRIGYWREPYHGMVRRVADSDLVISTYGQEYDPFTSRSFIKDANHFTIGGGISLSRMSIDAALDYSKPSRRITISAVFYL